MNLQECIDNLLVEATFDWICTADFLGVADRVGGAKGTDEEQTVALHLMREVVRQGLMEIGDLPESDTGQRPLPLKKWPGTPECWLDRVEREWPKRRGSAEYGVYCWFQNTLKGSTRGHKVVKSKNSADDSAGNKSGENRGGQDRKHDAEGDQK